MLTMWLQAAVVAIVIPLGLDLYLPVPEDNPLTAEGIALGRQLFFDARLSRDGTISCATCHQPGRAFSDGRALAVGIAGRVGRRNAPALVNRGYGRAFFWDARLQTLEEQVVKPIEDPNEMGFSVAQASARLGLASDEISRALSSYVRSILSGNSRFDRFANGDRTALSKEEQRGLAIFRGKGNCTACHVGPNFTDERTHNTGVAWRPSTSSGQAPSTSSGQAGVFSDEGAGHGAFKTPTLRDVSRTAPYMHDGSLATLDEVVSFYDRGGNRNPQLDDEIRPIGLAPAEKQALLAFLLTLSGDLQEGRR
jgi:cytochrome c peroxidase